MVHSCLGGALLELFIIRRHQVHDHQDQIAGLTAFKEELLRQADEITKMAINAPNRTGKAFAGGQVKLLTVIGRQTNFAMGKGSIACTSIGGVGQEPTCVTGSGNMTTDRKNQ